ncbi:hypothetical protein BLNAU_8364 [Blattamonas nauphoetae]|uniref:Uncharacterized protein n=1 Tax=Blattamonas nauphoetae TaxID=2049346 RepID=A0ABQ9XZ16_9EUKA|nr:hypothetical protein BLNAU_8364 [Blattamonas nauphoetae]
MQPLIHPLANTLLGAHGQCIPKNGEEAAYVKMNVIDVFGLTPRMLGGRVSGAFLDLIHALAINSLLTDDEYTLPTISHLTFNGLSKNPFSSFAARLFTELETLKSAHFLELVHNRELEERLREQMFKSKVNDELLVSHAKLTVYSAMPNGLRNRKQRALQQTSQRSRNPTEQQPLDWVRFLRLSPGTDFQ